jgi:cyanate lyase
MARLPTIGYATRTEAVVALRKAGLSTPEIMEKIGADKPNSVYILERQNRRKKDTTKKVRLALVLHEDTLISLNPHAERRDITVNDLCQRLIETIVSANMTYEILRRTDNGVK